MDTNEDVIHISEESVFEWKIPEFLSLSEKADEFCQSSPFSFAGASWFIRLYPNGRKKSFLANVGKETDTEGYVDLYIWRNSLGSPIKLQYAFGLKINDERIDSSYHYSRCFERMQGYGILRLMKRGELFNPELYEPSDTLVVACKLKHLKNSPVPTLKEEMCGKDEDYAVLLANALSWSEELSGDDEATDFPVDSMESAEELCVNDVDDAEDPDFSVESEGDSEELEDGDGETDFATESEEDSEEFEDGEISDSEIKALTEEKENDETLLHQIEGVAEELETPRKSKGEITETITVAKAKILQDLKQLFVTHQNCDVILKVKDQEFSAHRAILTARSLVFASTFEHDMKEKATGIVNIDDCEPSVFSEFLGFLYHGETDSVTKDNVYDLFAVADKYDVPELKMQCIKLIKADLSTEKFCDTINLALRYSETDLMDFATDFFVKNVEKIIVSVDWQNFAKENPTTSNELFIKYVASVQLSKK